MLVAAAIQAAELALVWAFALWLVVGTSLAIIFAVYQESKLWSPKTLPSLTLWGTAKVAIFNVVWTLGCLLGAILVIINKVLSLGISDSAYEAHCIVERFVGFACLRGLVGRVKLCGMENLPDENTIPAPVYVANHASQIDLAAVYFMQRRFKWISKQSVLFVPGAGQIMGLSQHVFIQRRGKNKGKSVSNLFDKSSEAVQSGIPMFFFPQGTRAMAERLPFKDGAFIVAETNKSSIVPLSIDIPRNAWNSLYPFLGEAPVVTVTVHPPIPVTSTSKRDVLKQKSMDAIYSAVPTLLQAEEVTNGFGANGARSLQDSLGDSTTPDSTVTKSEKSMASDDADSKPKTLLPPWKKPEPESVTHDPGLKVMNSLTREKEHFLTMDGTRNLTWYMCGPTVYAESHMGHARAYLGFDIIRRILEKHFGYNVTLIMNITDVDDKIIERSAERKMEHLELTRHFEQEFHKDMSDLHVAPPTVVTRVTEYMEEIVAYIARIIERGYAYVSNGSVYFHVEAFEQADDMHYCKLAPEQIHNAALLAEGEGKLTQDFAGEKKSHRDFALWKKSKPGEPVWPAPWGDGRPGWHIECSVMASDILNKLVNKPNMDIHSGGVDLKFPHHDNEMAQAEAECGHTQWVNYFVHAGHLHIRGLKMSKSLKNFITIQQALEINTARQIRLLFLRHKYNAPMDYGDDTMAHAVEMERRIVEFFHNAKAFLRANTLKENQKWSPQTFELQTFLSQTQVKVDDALKDDFDTPTVLSVLLDLIKSTNVYMESTDGSEKVGLVVYNVSAYITRILEMLGLKGLEPIGLASTDGGDEGGRREDHLAPVLDSLMAFRSAVRDKARNKDVGAILELCDQFRDEALPPLGIRLEDKAEGAIWKLANPADLVLEMEQRQAEAARKAEEKAAQQAEAAAKEALNKLTPAEYMKQLTLEDGTTPMYTQFDEEGLPTHDSNNEELNKSQKKKVQKLFKTQQGKYDKWLKSQQN